MIEVAEVFRRFADGYLSAHDAGKPGSSMLPSHRRAITDILGCRTEALGGAPQPVHTFLNINQLAWPGMLVEVDVIAITKEP